MVEWKDIACKKGYQVSNVLKGRIFQTGGWTFVYADDRGDHDV